ncbi:MAG: hypothetical protein ACYTEU_14645, partial [Planctomycetota bacterium]
MRRKQGSVLIAFVGIFVCFSAPVLAGPTKTISGVVATDAGVGLEGASVVGNNGATSAVTAADGSYTITVSNNWTGTIAASKAGWLITPVSKAYTSVKADLIGENFLAYQPKISGIVTQSDGTPLAGAVVSADNGGGSDTTDATGYYEITVPYDWNGTVSATLADYHFTDNSYGNVTTDQANQDFSGFQPGIVTSTPDYAVTVPYGWSGTITAELAGYDFTNSPLSFTNVTTDLINQNFTPYQPTISGTITEANGAPVAGITVAANNGGGSDTTDMAGYYDVVVPYNWSGQLTANRLGWQIDPNSYEHINVTIDILGQNYQAVNIGIYVALDGSGDFTNIQSAINAATNGDIVKVEDGIYTGTGNRDVDFLGKAITVRGNVDDPNLVVIDCQGTEAKPHRGFFFGNEEDAHSILEGFTITNGYGPQEARYNWDNVGGAILCYYSNPTIQNCIISANTANSGGGIEGYYNYSKPTIRQCLIIGNTADGFGGGIEGCGGIIENCIIRDNSVNWSGGGLHGCGGTIRNCIINSNASNNYGGGLSESIGSISATIIDCTISENSAKIDGGGLYNCDGTIENCIIIVNSVDFGDGGGLWGCDGTIVDCAISKNIASHYGGGLFLCNGIIQNCTINYNSIGYSNGAGVSKCNGTIQNCVIWGNAPINNNQIYLSSVPSYSCIQNWSAGGIGNISDDPLLIDYASGNYHLSFESP